MSGFLLDTNVISELVKPNPARKVTSWLEGIDEGLLYLSVLTIGEIRKGITALAQTGRRVAIEAWLEKDLSDRFVGRILPVTKEIANRWGVMAGQAHLKKILVPVIDGLMAATAQHYNLTLVTRNIKDIVHTRVDLFNPWDRENTT